MIFSQGRTRRLLFIEVPEGKPGEPRTGAACRRGMTDTRCSTAARLLAEQSPSYASTSVFIEDERMDIGRPVYCVLPPVEASIREEIAIRLDSRKVVMGLLLTSSL